MGLRRSSHISVRSTESIIAFRFNEIVLDPLKEDASKQFPWVLMHCYYTIIFAVTIASLSFVE